ncbi:MAG: PaaI family thioesterase [Alphaproteobacteria bacterium]|nr:PaaI family thioesterase [Alphaproteobacteria bacterium]MBV9419863.1 PaaI family thioesterase [Alphaproteobacteria bacterium]MBV9541929.1 PaaI family thioesterase [Alphaproteobacteria bacterium]MBV9905259.1 PaaI family thioesterase [Alphaproteobacteria bacterium]
MSVAPPPGFIETRLIDPFEIYVGPVWEQGAKGARKFAFRVDQRHVNMRGVIHGGMLMTFADAAFGQAAWDATDHADVVTLNMQSQFLAPAKEGDLVEVAPVLTRRTRSLIFLRGDFMVDGEAIFSVSSVWKILGAT